MSSRKLTAALVAFAVMSIAACSPTIRRPQLLHPGPANIQRYNASQFDPYPQTDMGPEIVGGRPPDFLVPVPEVDRANQYRRGERPINLANPGAVATVPVTAPVFVPTAPAATMPGVPVYPTTPIATQPPVSSQPPVEYRY